MTERIERRCDKNLVLKRNAFRQFVACQCNDTGIHIGDTFYDKDGLRALRDMVCCYLAAGSFADLCPLAPRPVPEYRPMTPVECAEHLGREVEYEQRYYYLAMVGEHHVELSDGDDGIIPKIMHEVFAKVATWRDTGEPCGVRI